jgi:hypothetical protein
MNDCSLRPCPYCIIDFSFSVKYSTYTQHTVSDTIQVCCHPIGKEKQSRSMIYSHILIDRFLPAKKNKEIIMARKSSSVPYRASLSNGASLFRDPRSTRDCDFRIIYSGAAVVCSTARKKDTSWAAASGSRATVDKLKRCYSTVLVHTVYYTVVYVCLLYVHVAGTTARAIL